MAIRKVKIKSSKFKTAKKYIMEFPDERLIWFQMGNINNWFVNTSRYPEPEKITPSETMNFDKDVQMLSWLLKMQDDYGSIVMAHIRTIYNLVKTRFEMSPVSPLQTDWDLVMELAGFYEKTDVKKVSHIFGYVYYAMISEENYENTKLGKKLKLLGIHQVLLEGMKPEDAACWSKCDSTAILAGGPNKRKYVRLLAECKIRGII